MSKNIYVIENNGNYSYIKTSGFVPKDAILGKLKYKELEPDVLEDARWIQLEQIADAETGELIPTFTVNETLKAQIEAQDLLDSQERANEEAIKAATKDALLDKLIALDIDTVNDLAAIKAIFLDIRSYFLYKYDADIKEKVKKDKDKK